MSSERLERSGTDRVISGVCGGIAEYLAVDATLVRVFFVLTAFFGGIGVLAYIALLFLMPVAGRPPASFAASAGATAQEVAQSLRQTGEDFRRSFRDPGPASETAADATTAAPPRAPEVDAAARARDTERRRMAFGFVLIVVGAVFLLGNAGLFRAVQWQLVWPAVLIAVGVLLLIQRVRW
jgi:phage shock protein C